MSRIYERSLSSITAQASAAITADSVSGGTQTAINKASSGNADGAIWFDVYLDVTAAPSAEASCELYMQASPDGGSNYAYDDYCLTCAVKSGSADIYRLGTLHDTPQNFKLSVTAIDYGFTASLVVVPIYPADV